MPPAVVLRTNGVGDTTWVRKTTCDCYIQDSMGLDVKGIMGTRVSARFMASKV